MKQLVITTFAATLSHLACAATLTMTPAALPADAAAAIPVIDAPASQDALTNYRHTGDLEKIPASLDRTGMAALHMHGSAEFTPLAFAQWRKTIAGPVTVFDLRQEAHGFINGQAVTWYAERDWGQAGMTHHGAIVHEAEKGSFYHYFENKDAFGQALITRYADYFARKLERHFSDTTRAPLARIRDAIADLQAGMARHEFRRGCLVGNLGQEMGSLPEAFRTQLSDVFADWQQRLARCLREAQAGGEIPEHIDCDEAASFFWIGWEGAVLRAKLERRMAPLELFVRHFFAGLHVTE